MFLRSVNRKGNFYRNVLVLGASVIESRRSENVSEIPF